ncbi:MAG: methyltransferase domain-containing protein [Gammaproteobacteria bacterium]|nr:methyltransferase domain-containing protein [Gammaproteobacteria bacterium]
MIRTRRDFLNMGYYDFLIEPAIELIAKHSHAPRQLLDIGCGDGYFTNSIFSALEYEKAYGLDISSEALKVAAKRNPDIHWCVASNRDIPLPPNSVSCILKINTPTNLQSINTVLKDEGFILSVTPGPRHLDGLKKLIYENPQLHEREPAFSTYVLVDEVLTETQLLINNNEDIQALFLMTPYAWNASNAAKEKIQQLATLETHVSFQLSLWQKQKETL